MLPSYTVLNEMRNITASSVEDLKLAQQISFTYVFWVSGAKLKLTNYTFENICSWCFTIRAI